MFATAPEAIAAVRAAQAAGIRSIDVGCMQISLLHHPDAFVSLEQAFDPAANVAYASRFLQSLRLQTGDWAGAVAAYHSMTPDIGAAYAGRVAGVWPLAARYGLSAAALPGGRLSLEDEVDPRRLLTPEFRAELVAAAAFRRQQDMALGAGFQAFRGQGSGPSRPRHGTRMPALAALEDEVDPRHLLTPEFRAQRAEAAAFRYQEEAALDRATRSGAP